MNQRSAFSLSVSQNRYLSASDTELHAILTVATGETGETGETGGAAGVPAAVVLAIDCSGSMGQPPTKIAAARRATQAAIDALRDGVFFGVVEGTHEARLVYPPGGVLVPATEQTRQEARSAVRRMVASGATAMGTWLREADRLLAAHPAAVRHAILLTDGRDLPRYAQDLDEALAACEGRFVCDGRGIGDDYEPEVLQRITTALRGSADAIVEDADLVAHFTGLIRAAMGKVVPDVLLRVRAMPHARLRFLREVYPVERDLTAFGTAAADGTTAFTTGSWGDGEEREYELCLAVDRAGRPMGEDIQAARLDLAPVPAGSEPAGPPRSVLVHWTADLELSSVIHPKVAHYNGYVELAAAVKEGWDAYKAGDRAAAEAAWGRAVAQAAGLRHDDMLTRLARLVEIIGDPAGGVVRIRPGIKPGVVSGVLFGSHMTNQSPAAEPGSPCAACRYVSPAGNRFCPKCGAPREETA